MSTLQGRDEVIKSGSESGGVKSAVASSRWTAATHLREQVSIHGITYCGFGERLVSHIRGRVGLDDGEVRQSGRRHWPHCWEMPSALACWDPGRYSKVTENCPRSIYHRASMSSLLQNFWSQRRDQWSVRIVSTEIIEQLSSYQ